MTEENSQAEENTGENTSKEGVALGSSENQAEESPREAILAEFAGGKYAIIKAKGKQFVVREGVKIVTDRINVEEGQAVTFDDVLLVGGEGGAAKVRKGAAALGATISGTVLEHKRGKKITSYKKKRRHGYERKVGHRSDLSVVMIDKIA